MGRVFIEYIEQVSASDADAKGRGRAADLQNRGAAAGSTAA